MSRKKATGCFPRTRDRVSVRAMPNAQATPSRSPAPEPPARLTARQRQGLEFIDSQTREQGYPPSVREIGEAVGLSSPSTVHAHLAALQDKGYLRRDPSKPAR